MIKKTLSFLGKINFKTKLTLFVVLCLGSITFALTKPQALQNLLVMRASDYHYSQQDVDDTYSEKAFHLYIERLDPNKRFFTQEDIVNFSIYKFLLDNEIKKGEFNFFKTVHSVYLDRIKEFQAFISNYLNKQQFSFESTKTFESDPEKITFTASRTELVNRWETLLEYRVLNSYLNLKQGKVSKNIQITAQFDQELEAKAREKILDDYSKFFSNIEEEEEDDYLNFYLDTLVNVFDTHSSYFPAAKKEQFDINISGKLEGIGAELREENGYIKVVRIVAGSASFLQGDLQPEDLILKVGQGDEEPVDTVGMKVSKIVQLIRGKKGTEVRLTVRHVDGEEEVIPIIRDIVEIEETYTKTTIIEDSLNNKRIGYVHVPKFYRDIKDNKGRNTTDDVKNALDNLNQSNIDGIILDLRYNEGGFLVDAVRTAGLFINSGPIVQVKSHQPNFNIRVLEDQDRNLFYTGPLVVLINTYSASASEILAAALQDYGRAIIVGTNSFGKGTVQQFVDLDRQISSIINNFDRLGSLKITIQKFYRINGGSTQERGVIPDITIPDTFSAIEIGESYLKNNLPWDTVKPVSYSVFDNATAVIPYLRDKSEARMERSEEFQSLFNQLDYIKSIKDNSLYSLNINDALKLKLEIDSKNKEFDEFKYLNENITFDVPQNMTIGINVENSYKLLYDNLKSDLQIYETLSIISDLIDKNNVAKKEE